MQLAPSRARLCCGVDVVRGDVQLEAEISDGAPHLVQLLWGETHQSTHWWRKTGSREAIVKGAGVLALFIDMGEPVLLQERRESIPTVRMSFVQRIPVALGVEVDGVGVVLDAADRAMGDLVVFGQFQSARVVGEQQSGRSGQQRRDVAVNAGTEGEVVMGQMLEPGLRI